MPDQPLHDLLIRSVVATTSRWPLSPGNVPESINDGVRFVDDEDRVWFIPNAHLARWVIVNRGDNPPDKNW